MRAYAARWLPLLIQSRPNATTLYEETARDYWRAARKDMLKVINRTSYRSVLTLYLYSQTPVPVGIPEEEEHDGLSGVVCLRTALLQVQQLRERLRSCQFNGSDVAASSDTVTNPTSTFNLTQAYTNLESRAYWGAIMWDTSSAMTLNFRSSLTSGLKGACLEPTWCLARSFLVGAFHVRTQLWHEEGFEVSDEIASQIISGAGVCTIYTWRTIASLKEALREGVEEDIVLFAWDALLDALEVFKTTIHPLLHNCKRQLHFLGQVNRLFWYEVVLQYYMGILILFDALEASSRSDLISRLTDTRLEAELECFNVLKFGLESQYIVDGPLGSHASEESATSGVPRQPITASFVAIDPYPHHVVATALLMHKAIRRKCRQGTIQHEVYTHLCSTLLKALQQLPQRSKAVQAALKNMQESVAERNALSVSDGL